MTYTVQIPSKIQEKIKDQALIIAEDKPQAAYEWYDHVYDKIRSLNEHPKRCPIAPESRYFDFEVRHLLIGNYRVLFCVEAQEVIILDFKGGRENKPS